MDETKLLGEGTELHVDRIAISGTFESVGEAAQIRRREHLGIAVPRADLASDERHADMSVDTNGTMLLKLDPRCADRLDVELAPPLPTYAHAPNRLRCADIKEIPTWEGKLYLASVLDCFSRRVVGWSMRDNMEAELVVDALEMAVARRRPEPGLIHHSDQGSQYVALVFGQRLRGAGIAQSIGSKGDCFDNAAIESYHATIEKDLLRRRSFRTRQEAQTALFDYIETFYNRERLHSTLGYRSPDEYERDHKGGGDYASRTDEMIFIEEQARAA